MTSSAPQPLDPQHDLRNFDCGVAELNNWLKKRAWQNQLSNATRTYVLSKDGQVVGFHALAAGSVRRDLAISRVRRNTPEPVPVIVLARLAVAKAQQGQGYGGVFLLDAVQRALSAAKIIGARALLINALDDTAAAFYLHCGFLPSPMAPHLLMATMEDLQVTLE